MNLSFLLTCSLLGFSQAVLAQTSTLVPSDRQATVETRNLYANMYRLEDTGVLLGHHDDLAYGVGWRGDDNRSDVKSVTGQYPAVYGWDLSGIELGHDADINGISLIRQRAFVKEVYARGGINTFCWHLNNPVNGKTAWDTSIHTVGQIFSDKKTGLVYRNYLDQIAVYLSTLKGDKGEAIPLLFRPFHELTGNWFWWGRNTCTPEEFKALWKLTVDYLREKKKLHNLLIVYSTSDFKTSEEFLKRYPGDNYADVLGFDTYCYKDPSTFSVKLAAELDTLKQITALHHKLSAIAEIGYEGLPVADWFTSSLLPVIRKRSLSYLMFWRNAGTEHFYLPYPGQLSAGDFSAFSQSQDIIFQNKLSGFNVYGR